VAYFCPRRVFQQETLRELAAKSLTGLPAEISREKFGRIAFGDHVVRGCTKLLSLQGPVQETLRELAAKSLTGLLSAILWGEDSKQSKPCASQYGLLFLCFCEWIRNAAKQKPHS
jgi:hypothetical protein